MIRLFILFAIEKIHRIIFGEIFVQNGKRITKKQKILLAIHKFLFRNFPNFRAELKYKKQVLARAYRLRKLSIKNYLLYRYFLKLNTERYSGTIYVRGKSRNELRLEIENLRLDNELQQGFGILIIG